MVRKLELKYDDIKNIERGASFEHTTLEKILYYPMIILELAIEPISMGTGGLMSIFIYFYMYAFSITASPTLGFMFLSEIGIADDLSTSVSCIIAILLMFLGWYGFYLYRRKMKKFKKELEHNLNTEEKVKVGIIDGLNDLIETPNEKLYRVFEFIDVDQSSENEIAIDIPNNYKRHNIQSENENIKLLDEICRTDKKSYDELIELIKIVQQYHHDLRITEEIKRKERFINHKSKMQFVNHSDEPIALVRGFNRIRESNNSELEENKKEIEELRDEIMHS